MTSLVDAYQRNNINEFERTLKTNRRAAIGRLHSVSLGVSVSCMCCVQSPQLAGRAFSSTRC